MNTQNQNMNMNNRRDDESDDRDMEGLEEFMRWRMVTEMSDMMMSYMDYKVGVRNSNVF